VGQKRPPIGADDFHVATKDTNDWCSMGPDMLRFAIEAWWKKIDVSGSFAPLSGHSTATPSRL
jgi:hypothetical protein